MSTQIDDVAQEELDLFPNLQADTTFLEHTPINAPQTAQAKIERYLFEKEVNKGGMKAIIGVRDEATQRKVAMAVLNDKTIDSQESRERFLQEARITAHLEHPNIVPIHDIGINTDGSPFFTMKLLGGETLSCILRKLRKNELDYRKKYPLQKLLLILLKVLDAISFAHAQGIIHLDLKPDNIQIGEHGEVLVLDWGLARKIQKGQVKNIELDQEVQTQTFHIFSHSQLTLDGEIKGTIGYMAPEQARGYNQLKDERTDIYALGAILYSILCWYRPIKGRPDVTDQFMRALESTIEGRVLNMHEQNPHASIPIALEAVVKRAMCVNPAERYPCVEAFRNEILKYLEGFPTEAEKAPLSRHILLWVKRHKWFSLICLLITLGTLAFGLSYYNEHQRTIAQWGREQNLLPTLNTYAQNMWIVREGSWNIQPHSITSTTAGSAPSRLQYHQRIYGNIAIEIEANVLDHSALKSGGDLSFFINADPDNHEDGYFFQLGGFSNTVATIQRRNGFVCMTPFSIEPGRTYAIRIEKEAGVLRLFCDGQLLLQTEEVFYLEGGYLGLYAFGEGKHFSSIKLFERGIPALVSALTPGDAFFRKSRATKNQNERELFLRSAYDAYTAVLRDHARSTLGEEALLKRSYISLELGDFLKAEQDFYTLENSPNSGALAHLLLGGEIRLRMGQFQSAHDFFSQALEHYSNASHRITGILMARLSDEKIFGPNSELFKQYFWKLAAAYQKTAVFRARTKSLGSLEFLRDKHFEMLDVSNNQVQDLSPLSEMRLKHLNCSHNPIESLAPLAYMQLEELDVSFTDINDLTPLLHMPLRTLNLSGCKKIKNISPLYALKSLEKLTLPAHISTPERDLIKRALPRLK